MIRFPAPLEIAHFDDAAAQEYGRIKAGLEKKGKTVGTMDMLIGSSRKHLFDMPVIKQKLRPAQDGVILVKDDVRNNRWAHVVSFRALMAE